MKIGFVDTFDGMPQYFMHRLEALSYDVERDDDNPDVLFFADSNFGKTNEEQRYLDVPVRVFYTGENVRPIGQAAHFAFSFDHIDCYNHARLPLWMLNIHDYDRRFGSVELSRKVDDPFNRGFCGFVQSNPNCQKRNFLFNAISDGVEQILSAGPLFNNTGFIIPRGENGVIEKLNWLRNHKFTFAAENGQYAGYATEKLLEAKMAGTVPIYWGSSTVSMDFNPKAFINWHDFGDDDAFISFIREVNQNESLYMQIFEQPLFDDERNSNLENSIRKQNVILSRIMKEREK